MRLYVLLWYLMCRRARNAMLQMCFLCVGEAGLNGPAHFTCVMQSVLFLNFHHYLKKEERVASKTLCTCPVLLDYSTAFIFWLWFRENLDLIHINERWDTSISYSHICDPPPLTSSGPMRYTVSDLFILSLGIPPNPNPSKID